MVFKSNEFLCLYELQGCQLEMEDSLVLCSSTGQTTHVLVRKSRCVQKLEPTNEQGLQAIKVCPAYTLLGREAQRDRLCAEVPRSSNEHHAHHRGSVAVISRIWR